MWFSNVYLKTLRDFRIAILGWGFGIGLLMFAVLSAVPALINTAAAKASLVSLASSFAWLAEPVSIATPGGYATWKYGPTILVIAIWPILVGSRMLRGEEERGSLDALLSLPRSRTQVALQKFAAMWTALLAMGLIIAVLVWLGGQTAKANFGFGGALLFGLNLMLACGVFGSVALFLSQFTTERRTAAGIAGALLLISILVDMLHRVIPNTEGISRLSPVYYYNLSKPLMPSYGVNVVAMLILVGFSVVFGGAAVVLFASRDVGGVVKIPGLSQLPQRSISPERALPADAWSLRSVYTRSLASLGWSTFWWTLIIAGLAGWMVVIVQQSEKKLAALAAGLYRPAGLHHQGRRSRRLYQCHSAERSLCLHTAAPDGVCRHRGYQLVRRRRGRAPGAGARYSPVPGAGHPGPLCRPGHLDSDHRRSDSGDD